MAYLEPGDGRTRVSHEDVAREPHRPPLDGFQLRVRVGDQGAH